MRTFLTVLLATVAIAVAAQPSPGSLFEPEEAARLSDGTATNGGSPLLRRTTSIDLGMLDAARGRIARSSSASIRLNLFDAVEYDGIAERISSTSSGYALSGRIGGPAGSFTIVVNGDVVAGDVRGPGGAYRLYGRGGTVNIAQMDPASLPRCEGGLIPSPGQVPLRQPPSHETPLRFGDGQGDPETEDDGSVVDVFVFYTVTTRRLAGGHDLMRANIDLDVAWTNEAYRASGVMQRINLVGVAETEDIPPGERSTLWRLTYRVPHVWAIRNAYAADLVALKHGRGGGLAWISVLNSRAEHLGYSLVGLYPPDTFAHELGHNMGLRHPRNGLNPDVENTPYPYSHGYVLPGLRYDRETRLGNFTIMDGSGGAGLQRFSNPLLEHKGIALGVPGDEPSSDADGPADAVRSLENTRRDVANYRSSATRCDYRLTPEAAEVPTGGGSFMVEVETDDDCSWSVRSHDGAVAVESAEDAAGDGQVTYRVAANDGWERTLALRIAGETFLVRQSSDRVPTPVCDRTAAVRDAIAETLGKSCEEVDATDLNRIASLVVRAPTDPVAGDFDGMTNLGELDLKWSGDGPLPATVFGGLVNVVKLVLTGPGLEAGALDPLESLDILHLNGGESLAAGLFAQLPDLEQLLLHDYDLAGLPAGSFRGLGSLTTLSIAGSRIGTVEQGAFDGLGALSRLFLIQSEIGSLESGAFQGLPDLRTLQLYSNNLTRLVPGTFDGLSEVEWLNLQRNELSELDRQSFRGLLSIEYLWLDDNRLKTLPEGVFSDLTTLRWRLYLSGNQLESLAPGTFAELGNLLALYLDRNQLEDLAPGTFDGLTNLTVLDLADNALKELRAGLFDPVPSLGELRLHGNRLTRLPDGIFAGLTRLTAATLRDNPGAPFDFVLNLDRAPRADLGTESVALRVDQGAPFAMVAGLSVDGGTAATGEVDILAGQTHSDGVGVTPADDGVVTVSIAAMPSNPSVLGCERTNRRDYGNLKPCYPGVRLVAGDPIFLYGIPDKTLSDHEPAAVDLGEVFGVFFDSDELSFTATSSDSGIVKTAVAGGTLTLTPDEAGTATVTVAASDGETTVTRRFVVTVSDVPRTQWRGWRLGRLLLEQDD